MIITFTNWDEFWIQETIVNVYFSYKGPRELWSDRF